MADHRIAWLALFTAAAIGMTACAATTATDPEPTPAAASMSILPKGDLPVVQAPTTSSATTTAPAPPPGVPATTSAPATAVLVQPGAPAVVITPTVTSAPPTITPAPPVGGPVTASIDPRIVVDPGSLRLPRPGKTTATPTSVQPPCTPGVSPAPVIRGVIPNKGDIKGGTDVLISGSNLDLGPGTTVMFGNTPGTVWGLGSSSLSVLAPPGAAGPVTLRLSNPGGCSATAQFTYVNPNAPVTAPPTSAPPTTAPPTSAPATTAPATTAPPTAPAINGPCPGGTAPPTITGMLPRELVTVGGQSVEIFGRGFATGSGQTAVFINGVQITPKSVIATRIQLVSPPGPPGPITIKVAVPLGCATYTAAALKYVVPKPVIASISPSQGPKAGGTTVVITGQYLSNATVKIASTPATVTSNSDTSVTVVTPSVRYAGNSALTLTTPGGSTGTIFRYTS